MTSTAFSLKSASQADSELTICRLVTTRPTRAISISSTESSRTDSARRWPLAHFTADGVEAQRTDLDQRLRLSGAATTEGAHARGQLGQFKGLVT